MSRFNAFGHQSSRTEPKLLMDGLSASGQQWIEHSDVEIHAVYDRFPSQLRRQLSTHARSHLAQPDETHTHTRFCVETK